MPKPRSLTPDEAKRTLAHRLTGKIDRVRQVATRLGLRSTRVFLVWTKWTGSERGEGQETVRLEYELLPTPKVESMDAISLRLWAMGTVPDGTLRLTGVSGTLTRDILMGLTVPNTAEGVAGGDALPPHPAHMHEPDDFFYELREDGRGDDAPVRMKFRIAGEPVRREGQVDFSVMIERVSEDRDRQGQSQIDRDED